MPLWDIILNDQLRAVCRSRVAAIEFHVIRAIVVIVIRCKAKAELSCTSAVDIQLAGAIQGCAIPAAGGGGVEHGNRYLRRCCLEIVAGQPGRCTKVGFA